MSQPYLIDTMPFKMTNAEAMGPLKHNKAAQEFQESLTSENISRFNECKRFTVQDIQAKIDKSAHLKVLRAKDKAIKANARYWRNKKG